MMYRPLDVPHNMNCVEAYAHGYFDGRHKGYEINPYQIDTPERYWYYRGYDSGVGHYCRRDIEELEGVCD